MNRPLQTRANLCWTAAVLLALLLGWWLGTNYSSPQPQPASKIPPVYASSDSQMKPPGDKEAQKNGNSGAPAGDRGPGLSKYDILREALKDKDIADMLRFNPIDEGLNLSESALKIYGMESYAPALKAVVATTKEALHAYDREHLEELPSSGPEKAYLIPGDPKAGIREKFEAEIRAVLPDKDVADFFLKKTRDNIADTSGNYGAVSRVLRIRALSAGDEEQGFPEMKYTVQFNSLHPQTSLESFRQELAKRPPGGDTAWMPLVPNLLSSFKEPPDYLAHLLEK